MTLINWNNLVSYLVQKRTAGIAFPIPHKLYFFSSKKVFIIHLSVPKGTLSYYPWSPV